MREIAILSGKGGTGKTSFVGAFATLAKERVVLGDCDVDAANLALLLPGKDESEEPFFAGRRARIDEDKCAGCAACMAVCRFRALSTNGTASRVDDLACEGCGACALVCPEDAIRFVANRSGTIYQRETPAGPLVHASLGIAQDNSGKLVTRVRSLAKQLATARGIDTVLYDGPPGIGCPVHATLSGVSTVVAVAEPTPSGVHDVERLLDLTAHFQIQTLVIVNKFDLNPELTESLRRAVEERGVSFIGGVPFNEEVPRALARGEGPLQVPMVREALQRVWALIEKSQ
jgi:MinD superfamily P-loop ATPase